MPLTALTVSILLSVATVSGGTDSQRKTVEDALKKVPDCLQSCDGKTPKVEIVSSDELNASYDNADTLHVNDCLLDAKRRDEALSRAADEQCTDKSAIPAEPGRIIVHELAHYYYQHHLLDSADGLGDWHRNLNGVGPNERGRAFLSLRFEALWETWSKSKTAVDLDTSLRQVGTVISALRAAKKPIPPAVRKVFCDLEDQLSEEYRGAGPMPERFAHDRHAFDGNAVDGTFGTEYFAIAIETMLFEPDAFCAAYSADEQAWLMKEMGDCLKPMLHGEPCSSGSSTSTGGGVTR